MKKGWVLMVGLFLAACMPTYQKPYQVKDYTQEAAIELPADQLILVSEVEADQKPPHVEKLMPITPEKALLNWAYIRLRDNHQKPYVAKFVVKEASMVREEMPAEAIFRLENYKYTLTYQVELQLVNDKDTLLKGITVEGYVMRTQPIRSSVQDRDAMMVEMLDEMEKTVNEKMTTEIQQKFVDFSI